MFRLRILKIRFEGLKDDSRESKFVTDCNKLQIKVILDHCHK